MDSLIEEMKIGLPERIFFRQEGAVILAASGRDAPRYLNARLTNDVRSLPLGEHCLAAALSAQGKAQGLFQVLRIEESKFLLCGDGGDREGVMAAVKKFIVADRVEIEDRSSELVLLHAAARGADMAEIVTGGSALGASSAWLQGDQFAWRRDRVGVKGIDMLVAVDRADAWISKFRDAGLGELGQEEREVARIVAGHPAFPTEINDSRLFLESGLKNAISFSKGCYVGQEVVEKIESHGRLPRCLVRYRVEGERAGDGAEIRSEDGVNVLGTVVSGAMHRASGSCFGFASVKADAAGQRSKVKIGDRAGELI